MKTLKIVSCAVLMLGLLLSSGMPGVEAATSLGDFCWQVQGGAVTRLGVTDMGGGHFLVHGRTVFEGGVIVVHGNAEIVGEQVIMTVNYSEGDRGGMTGMQAGIGQVVLNLSNLNGTSETLRLGHNNLDPDPQSAFARHSPPEAMTFIPCP